MKCSLRLLPQLGTSGQAQYQRLDRISCRFSGALE